VCVALGTQHAKRMRRIVICGLPGCTIFSTLRHDFREKLLNIKMYVLIFCITLC